MIPLVLFDALDSIPILTGTLRVDAMVQDVTHVVTQKLRGFRA